MKLANNENAILYEYSYFKLEAIQSPFKYIRTVWGKGMLSHEFRYAIDLCYETSIKMSYNKRLSFSQDLSMCQSDVSYAEEAILRTLEDINDKFYVSVVKPYDIFAKKSYDELININEKVGYELIKIFPNEDDAKYWLSEQ